MTKHSINKENIQEAKEAFNRMTEDFEFLKCFFRDNCDRFTWERLSAYSIGNIDTGLFKEGDYIGGQQSFEETIETLELQVEEDVEEEETEE